MGGNLALLDELATEDFVDHYMAAVGGPPGRAGLHLHVAGFRKAVPDAHITIDELLAEGDTVVAIWRLSGTHQGPLMGVAPTGRELTVSAVGIFHITAGRLASYRFMIDPAGIQQLVAMRSAPESAGEG